MDKNVPEKGYTKFLDSAHQLNRKPQWRNKGRKRRGEGLLVLPPKTVTVTLDLVGLHNAGNFFIMAPNIYVCIYLCSGHALKHYVGIANS